MFDDPFFVLNLCTRLCGIVCTFIDHGVTFERGDHLTYTRIEGVIDKTHWSMTDAVIKLCMVLVWTVQSNPQLTPVFFGQEGIFAF